MGGAIYGAYDRFYNAKGAFLQVVEHLLKFLVTNLFLTVLQVVRQPLANTDFGRWGSRYIHHLLLT